MNLKIEKNYSHQKAYDEGHGEGVRYALEYLREVYGEGIEATDLWAEYMNEEAN